MRRKAELFSRAAVGVGALVLVLGASTPGVGGEPVVAAAGVIVTVSPSTGLVDRQTVSVTASGLPMDTDVYVVQCATDDAIDACAAIGDAGVTTDGAGGLEHSGPVRRVIPHALTGIDCARPDACEVAILGDGGRLGTAPLNFEVLPPLAPPMITVDPASDLVDGQMVTVSGSGFPAVPTGDAPGGEFIVQCRADAASIDDCDRSSSLPTPMDAEGAFSRPFVVHRVISTENGAVIDCGVDAGCVIVLSESGLWGPAHTVSAAIRFRSEVAPVVVAVPAITG